MHIDFNENNIDDRKIREVVKVLKNDGVIIIPTDTVYAFACSIFSSKAVDKICRYKGVKPEKANLSFLCHDLKNISEYTKPFDRPIYKLLNRSLPGPFTFILESSGSVPSIFRSRKKTIGIRIPNHQVTLEIIRQLGHPLMAASLHNDDDPIKDYLTDPGEIFEKYENTIDLIVNAGPGGVQPSTVVDCTGDSISIVREGKGILEL